MLYRLLCSLLLVAGLLAQPMLAAASGITTYPALVSPDYWLKQKVNGEKLVLNANAINSFNSQIRSLDRKSVV